MRNLILISFVLIFGCDKYDFDLGLVESLEIKSDFEDTKYKINIGLPLEYHSQNNSYDLLIVLDGDPDFTTTASLCQKYSEELGKQNVIVVGVMNYSSHGRTFNYTPTIASGQGGGSTLFLQFITQQLIPELEIIYRLNLKRESRGIMGHSYGGLCSTSAFTDFNDYFGNFLLLSSSLIWDHQIMFEKEFNKRGEIANKEQLVFQSYGEMESLVIHLPNEAFSERIEEFYPNTIYLKEIIQGESHVSSKNKSIEKGLKFYFRNK